MQSTHGGFEPIHVPNHVWDAHRGVFAERDIGAIFRIAKQYAGASQTRIASATGMAQSRVNAMMRERAGPVTSIDVLLRIAEGLNLPDEARMLLGLAPRRARRPAGGARAPVPRASPGPDRGDDTDHGTPLPPAAPDVATSSSARVRALVREAAHLSATLTLAIPVEDRQVPALELAAQMLRGLADGYVLTSDVPGTLLKTLVLRGRLSEVLLSGSLRAGADRDARLLLGATCLLLASLSNDVGEPRAGMVQAEAAAMFAAQAEHPELSAWASCTKAMICAWSDRAPEVLVHTQAGLRVSGGLPVEVRLTGLRARALAQLGRDDEARACLRTAQDAAGRGRAASGLSDLGDLFTFPEARRHYYAAATLALLGDHRGVQESVAQVNTATSRDAAGSWSASRALSCGHLALAVLSEDGPQAAHEVLGPVFGLPGPARIVQIDQVLRAIDAELTAPAFAGHRPAAELAEALRDYREAPR